MMLSRTIGPWDVVGGFESPRKYNVMAMAFDRQTSPSTPKYIYLQSETLEYQHPY